MMLTARVIALTVLLFTAIPPSQAAIIPYTATLAPEVMGATGSGFVTVEYDTTRTRFSLMPIGRPVGSNYRRPHPLLHGGPGHRDRRCCSHARHAARFPRWRVSWKLYISSARSG